MTTTYTTACTYAGLSAAADLAEAKGDNENAVSWRAAAEDIRENAHKYLYNHDRKAFYKGLIVIDGQIRYDDAVDTSSIFGAYMFGLFDMDSSEMKSAISTLRGIFNTNSNIEAYPRYENDSYHRVDPNSQGNWWFIPTLWMAQYHIENGDMNAANSILQWVQSCSMKTGILSEQINPGNQAMIAPAPLGWSHAEFVSTLLDTMEQDSDSEHTHKA
jgi:GH15 family glucan-1,4-alpha-glucosidase